MTYEVTKINDCTQIWRAIVTNKFMLVRKNGQLKETKRITENEANNLLNQEQTVISF